MRFEEKLIHSLQTDLNHLNEDQFIQALNEQQKIDRKLKQQLTQTILGGFIILVVGILSFDSLNKDSAYYSYLNNEPENEYTIDTTEYINDMALFLLNDEEDIFETVNFLYELELTDLENKEEI